METEKDIELSDKKRLEKRLSLAKEFIRHLKMSVPSAFKSIDLNDYGTHSFSVLMFLPVDRSAAAIKGIAYRPNVKEFDLRKITNTIKRVAKTFGDIKFLIIEHPDRVYDSQKEKIGYVRSYTKITFEIHVP